MPFWGKVIAERHIDTPGLAGSASGGSTKKSMRLLDLFKQFDDFQIRLSDVLHRCPRSIGLISALGKTLPTSIAYWLRSFTLGLVRPRPRKIVQHRI